MLRLIVAILAFASALIYMPSAAAGTPLACQEEASAGLDWENGRWVVKQFHLEKFILVQEGDTLTKESVAKAFSSSNPFPGHVTCDTVVFGHISCHGIAGQSLYFSPKTQRGTIARTIGGVSTSPKRDSVVVEVFACTNF